MSRRNRLWILISLLAIALVVSVAVSACGSAATTTSASQATTTAASTGTTAASTTTSGAPPSSGTTATSGATTTSVATSSTTAGGKVSFGVVLPTKDEPRWLQDQARFEAAFKQAGYTVQILFSQGDSAVERQNVESLINQGVKVIVLCPQDATAAAAAAQEARAAGIKVISYDRLILNTDAVDYYVTFNSIDVGKAQGQYLVDHAQGKGNPLYLYTGAPTDNNAFLFFEGAWSVLQPKIADGTFVIKNSSQAVSLQSKAQLTHDEESKIIGQTTTQWKFDVAKNLAQANLTALKAADKGNVFILAPNDGTSRSIADAFAADTDVKSYVITGQDAEKPSIQYIIDGKQTMTVLKDVRKLADAAIAASIAFNNGQTPQKVTTYNNGKIDVPASNIAVVAVDKSNLKAAIFDSGYYSASDFQNVNSLP
jgi:putative multiple sugar transport system substrate-binding protein